MTDYETAFKRPFSDAKKLLIAILLNIIPIANFFVYGYFLEVAKSSSRKTIAILPEWKNWGNLFVNALLAFIISLVYVLPLILIALVVGFKIFLGMFTDTMASFATLGGMRAWLVLVLLYGFFLIYILPSAILSFAFSGKLSSAFKLNKVLKRAFNIEYFVAWLVSIVYSAVVGIALGLIPYGLRQYAVISNLVQYLTKAIGGAVTGITMFTLLGEVYSNLMLVKPVAKNK